MKNKSKYKLLAFLLGWIFLAFFIWQVDIQLVRQNLAKIGWQFGWILLTTGGAYAMASTAWLLCFVKIPNQISTTKLFIYRQIGETLTTVNPANIIVGESAKLYLLKKEGIDYQSGLASILLSRVLIMLSMVALFLVLPFLLINSSILVATSWHLYFGIGALGLLISAFFYGMVHEKLWLYQLVVQLERVVKFNFLKKIQPKIKTLNELLAQFYREQKSRLVLAFILSLLHWVMGAVEIYLLLFLLNVKCTFSFAVLIEVGVTCIKSLGAFIPGQIGVEEYGNKLMLELLSLGNNGLWLTLSVLRRTRQLFWLALGGLFFFIVYRTVGSSGSSGSKVVGSMQ